jgi:hypothetical protein
MCPMDRYLMGRALTTQLWLTHEGMHIWSLDGVAFDALRTLTMDYAVAEAAYGHF